MPDAMPLQSDVPCAKCGYDLRGLTPPGVCPECGHDLDASLRAAWLAPPPAERRWLRHVSEGVWCVLIAFGIAAAVGVHAGPNLQLLASLAAITGWVLTLIACLKLSRMEPRENARTAVVAVSRSLRIASIVGIVVACGGFLHDVRTGMMVPLLLTGITVNALFYLRLRHIALRLGITGLAGQMLIVAVMSGALVITVMSTWGGAPLGFFSVTAWTGFLRYVFRYNELSFVRALSWPVVVTACQVAVLIQLLVALRRMKRRPTAGP